MKFLDLNGLKHLLKRLVSYDSSNSIAVKRIEGKPKPGENNGTLVLGSGSESFPVNYSHQDINNITRSSILIGKKLRNSEDSSENKSIKILSNEDIINASPGEFKVSAGSGVNIDAGTSIHTNSSSVFMSAQSGLNLVADDNVYLRGGLVGNGSNNTSFVTISGNGIDMTTPDINIHYTKNGKKYLFIRSTAQNDVYLGGKEGEPMVALRRNDRGEPREIRFRVNSFTSARLTDNGTDKKGFYIFTNLYAKTDNSTDLPTNITSTAKEALDTKSVQCILAELLMKTGLY